MQGGSCGKQRTVCGCWVFYDAPREQEKTAKAECKRKVSDARRTRMLGVPHTCVAPQKNGEGFAGAGCGRESGMDNGCVPKQRIRKAAPCLPVILGNRHSARAVPLACVGTGNRDREKGRISMANSIQKFKPPCAATAPSSPRAGSAGTRTPAPGAGCTGRSAARPTQW